MSLRILASRLVHHGRRLFNEVLLGTKHPTLRIADKFINTKVAQESKRQAVQGQSFGQKCFKWFANTPVAELRRNAAKKLMYGGRNAAPFLGFVGINLVSGHGLITKKDELESICEEIRVCLGAVNWEKYDLQKNATSLKDLEIGKVIAKGCNAIVYDGKWKAEESEINNVEAAQNPRICEVERNEGVAVEQQLVKSFDGFDLAVKMMFNYSAESNATTILKAMNRETVPAREVSVGDSEQSRVRKKCLPPHSNIVALHSAFADSVPSLPGGTNLYPDALPTRLYEFGSGRNMTLFLVMKRYHTNLQEYLKVHEPSPTTRILLLAQLLEGVEHMVRHKVAHRDLKCDNILLDLSQGLDNPQLVISDFGCCLADDYLGLSLPFTSEEVDRGGNCVLMPPEVSNAIPGVLSIIDYSRSDLWVAGALAYEIYGVGCPFYGNRPCLDNRFYSEEELPELKTAPRPVALLVRRILARNPKHRPSPAVAANVCHLLLWGPPKLLTSAANKEVKPNDVLEWLVGEAAMSFSQAVAGIDPTVISVVRNLFLRRVHIREVEEALTYFVNS